VQTDVVSFVDDLTAHPCWTACGSVAASVAQATAARADAIRYLREAGQVYGLDEIGPERPIPLCP
jgi:hypothetical protein